MYLLYGVRDAVGNGPRSVGKGVSFYLLLGEWHCGSWFAGGWHCGPWFLGLGFAYFPIMSGSGGLCIIPP